MTKHWNPWHNHPPIGFLIWKEHSKKMFGNVNQHGLKEK